MENKHFNRQEIDKFWDSNDIAHQGAWFYCGVLESALERAGDHLLANGLYTAIEEINTILDGANKHVYTPEDKRESDKDEL